MRGMKPPGSRYEQPCAARPGSASIRVSTKADPSFAVGQASSAPRSSSSRMTGKCAYSDGPTQTERFRTRIRTPLSLSALVSQQCTRRRAARVKVESRAVDQDVHLQAEKAHRLLLAGFRSEERRVGKARGNTYEYR